MARSSFKNKFKLGQMVWYIADGYTTNRVIHGVFKDKWGTMCYSMVQADYKEGEHTFPDSHIKAEYDLYASKAELISAIEKQEDEKYDDN